MPVEDLRPWTAFLEELSPREGEEDIELVNEGITKAPPDPLHPEPLESEGVIPPLPRKAKEVIQESPETADPPLLVDPRYIPGLVDEEHSRDKAVDAEQMAADRSAKRTTTREEAVFVKRFRAAVAEHRAEAQDEP